ncbi:MAG: redoxin family protein [Bdellovibrio sp.]|nr:redoxin family protein [Bdellovibrio sp.]
MQRLKKSLAARNDLSEVSLNDFAGKKKVLNISAELPFAQVRFCGAEGIKNCETLSTFRSSFGKDYGVTIADSALAGLLSRAVIVLSADNTVLYAEQVAEIASEPNYENALKTIL